MPRVANNSAKPVPWDPLVGIMDNRSHPGEMPEKSFRYLQNWYFPNENTIRRRPQYTKFLSRENYLNEDYHDQLLPLQLYQDTVHTGADVDATITTFPNDKCGGAMQRRSTGRQPVTLLFGSKSSLGSRKLIAGTESRLSVIDESGGNWRIIADGLGRGVADGTCPGRRFKATQNQDAVLFTNDFNSPFYWLFGDEAFGCSMQSVKSIPDLEVIGLTRAALCWTWRGCTFLADIELDGVRFANGIVWSDYQDLTSWDPSKTESIAGSKILEPGERILGGVEMNNIFLVFTDQRIWQISVVGGALSFNFDKRYTPLDNGQGMLAYPNTLICTGDTAYYAGFDGFYKYDLYMPAPVKPEWLHRGTKIVFTDIDSALCQNTIAGFLPRNPETREVYLSWVPKDSGDGYPTQTLAIDLSKEKTSVIDFGMTALCFYEPDYGQTLREWLVENCACSLSALKDLGYGYVKEGLPRPKDPPDCDELTSIHTDTPLTVGGVTTEDYTKSTSDSGSLCAKVGDAYVQDFCNRCPTDKVFVFAHADDLCLKQFADVFSRENCTNPTREGYSDSEGYHSPSGTYEVVGFKSIMRSGAQHFGSPTKEKHISFFMCDPTTEVQSFDTEIKLRIGQSSQPVDSNRQADCALMWIEEDSKILACQTDPDPDSQTNAGTRPDENFGWPVEATGRYLYWELTVDGKGGDVAFGRVEQHVSVSSRRANV